MAYRGILNPRWLIFLPLAVVLVIAVACGGDENTPTASAPEATAMSPEATAMSPEATAMSPEATAMAPEATATTAAMAPDATAMAPEATATTAAMAPDATVAPLATALPTPTRQAAVVETKLSPVYGGVIPTESATGAPSTWDPHAAVYLEDIQVIGPMYSQLVEFNPLNNRAYFDGDIMGDIAETWEMADDGVTFTFHIRKGVQWSDGEPLDADDVVYSLERINLDGKPRPMTGRLRNLITENGITKIDQYTVQVVIEYPSPTFIPFAATDYQKILPEHYLLSKGGTLGEEEVRLELFEENQVGSGPFIAVENQHGVSSRFEKNPLYWKEGKPYWDGFHTFYIVDPGTEIAAYRTERILMSMDAINQLSVEDNLRLMEDEEFMSRHDIFWLDGAWIAEWGLNTQIPPFNDVNVRKAFFLALDRHELVEGLGSGRWHVGVPVDPGSPYAIPLDEVLTYPGFRQNPDGSKPQEDIDEAIRLLNAAGYTDDDPMKVTFTLPAILHFTDMGQVVKEQFRQFGLPVDMDLKTTDYTSGVDEARSGKHQMVALGRANMIPDPDDSFPAAFLGDNCPPECGKNWSHGVDAEVERLWKLQSQELDPDKRRELVYAMQRRVLEGETGVIGYAWPVLTQIVNKKIKTERGKFVPHFSLYTSLKHDHEFLTDYYDEP